MEYHYATDLTQRHSLAGQSCQANQPGFNCQQNLPLMSLKALGEASMILVTLPGGSGVASVACGTRLCSSVPRETVTIHHAAV